MDFDLIAQNRSQALTSVERCNELSERYGLSLDTRQIGALLSARDEVLRDTGRIEFGAGVLDKLIYAFCDSPYVDRDSYFDTLLFLQELFYNLKNETGDAFSDDELVEALHRAFDGVAQGSLDMLESLSPEALYRLLNETEE